MGSPVARHPQAAASDSRIQAARSVDRVGPLPFGLLGGAPQIIRIFLYFNPFKTNIL